MPIGSDNARQATDAPWQPRGTGFVMRFSCARCHKPSSQAGSGRRFVSGVKQGVCAGCKETIDARRKP